MPNIDLSILNQRQTPAFFADTLANRPAAGFLGRIFVSTDTFAFYRDNGTGWDLIGGPGTGTITGSGAAGQVTYFNGTSSITGNNNLFWDSVNGHLGIGTNAPGTALQINHGQSQLIRLNQTTATNDTKIAFQNSGVALWRIGNSYNAGANDYAVFDVVSNLERFSIKTTGQTFIGAQTTSSGRLVVNDATGDNHIVVIGATAPSLRINNSGSGATKQIGIGLATATNNFIQGAVDRDMAIFNGSTTPSPILFGIYGTTNIQEAARISASRNFLIGTTTDGGQKLQVNGGARTTGYYLDGMTAGSGALYYAVGTNRVTLANYNAGGILDFEVNGGTSALTIDNNRISTFKSTGGNGLRVYGGSGTNQWDIYLSGANLRIGDNTGGGIFQVDSNSTINGIITATSGLYVGSGTAGRNAFTQSDFRIAAPNDTNILNGIAANTSMTIKSDFYGGGSATPLILQSATNSNQLYLGTNGNIGISTSTPDQKVTIQAAGTSNGLISFKNSAGTTTSFIGVPNANGDVISGSTTADLLFRNETGNILFQTFGSERLRLTSSGNLLIGGIIDGGYKLLVSGESSFRSISAVISGGSTSKQGYVSYTNQDNGVVVNLATILPNVSFNGNFLSLQLQIVSTDGGFVNSSIINCARDFATSWSYVLVSSVGTANVLVLTFAGTSAAPTLQIVGAAGSIMSVTYNLIVR